MFTNQNRILVKYELIKQNKREYFRQSSTHSHMTTTQNLVFKWVKRETHMYTTQLLGNAALPITFVIQQKEKYPSFSNYFLYLTIQLPLFKNEKRNP